MTDETKYPQQTISNCLLLALPCAVILLSVMAWITAVSRSGFWADDFLNVTHFSGSLGDLSDDHINAGKYIINIFWAIGTEAFGSGSVVPFLMLNSFVFTLGLVMWLRAGTKSSWSSLEAWWVGSLFIATAAWFPTVLWSSNITHSGGFLALGVGLSAHRRSMTAGTARGSARWSVVSGAAWTLAIVSNILYIGLLVIVIYCAWHQFRKLRGFGIEIRRAFVIVSFWNLLLPIVYFFAVAYPGTTSNAVYAKTGLEFVHNNLRFYKSILAPTGLLTMVYVLLLAGGAIGSYVALRRRDSFPITVFVAAGATALPALVQGQQRDIHYIAMPLLLLFSALAAGARPVLTGQSRWLKGAILPPAVVTLLLLFGQGAGVRTFFVQSPYGNSLLKFRSEVSSLTPAGGSICAKLDLDKSQQVLLIAEMSGENGFLVPPINAAQAYFVPGVQPCPASGPVAHITISLNPRGDFVASG